MAEKPKDVASLMDILALGDCFEHKRPSFMTETKRVSTILPDVLPLQLPIAATLSSACNRITGSTIYMTLSGKAPAAYSCTFKPSLNISSTGLSPANISRSVILKLYISTGRKLTGFTILCINPRNNGLLLYFSLINHFSYRGNMCACASTCTHL